MRSIINVKDLSLFTEFLHLAAANTAQTVNYSKLSNEIGVDVKTIQAWYSLLEATYIVFKLRPFYNNYGKRISKRPKVYFYDVGIVAYLLNMTNVEQIRFSPLRGALFETMIISDMQKSLIYQGLNRQLYFWRDAAGNEIDCLVPDVNCLTGIGIKSSKTFNPAFLHGFDKFPAELTNKYLIYAGKQKMKIKNVSFLNWQDVEQSLNFIQ